MTDPLLLAEADRDQNVYLGALFTRHLTRAVPDLVFLPVETMEVVEAMRWARATGTPVTVRGAASAALGGAVANDGGLVLDLARLDKAEIDLAGEVCVVGAGARLRRVHRALARRGLALPVYPSNLGATLAGWLATGGAGLNAFGPGRALDIVRAADVVLPGGELVRLHADGRLDVAAGGGDRGHRGHREVAADQAEGWFAERGLPELSLADLAGSEGTLGVITQLVVAVGRRPEIGAFLLGFAAQEGALRAAAFIVESAGAALPQPANLEMISAAHLEHAAVAAADDARQAWRRFPSALSTGADLPWRRVLGPSELGVRLADCGGPVTVDGAGPSAGNGAGSGADGAGSSAGGVPAAGRAAAYLYVDFLDVGAARRFAARLADMPGAPVVLDRESVAFAGARFRPQAGKRLGPGLLAAEIDLPAAAVPGFLADAERLAAGAGVALEHEIYYLSGGRALAIAGYLTDHRSLAFLPELALSPALLDLAVRSHGGRPYVLGRWQGSFARDKFGDAGLARLLAAKAALDPARLLGRGVLFGLDLRGPLGPVVERVYRRGVRLAALAWGSPAAPAARLASAALRFVPGPGHRRGEPVRGVAAGSAAPRGAAARGAAARGDRSSEAGRAVATSASLPALARPLHCVNCGECNAVCPLYDALALRLPQSLVHAAETAGARRALPAGAAGLLDLCLRCGSCEQVCQAGIAHLATYAALEALRPTDASGDGASGAARSATGSPPGRALRRPSRRAAGHAGRPAPHATLPARLPGVAPGRVPAAHAGLVAGPRLLPGAARRGRRRRGLDVPPLRGLRGRLPVGRQPRVRGRRRPPDHHRTGRLRGLRHLRRGLSGQPRQRRSDPARARGAGGVVADRPRRVRGSRRSGPGQDGSGAGRARR